MPHLITGDRVVGRFTVPWRGINQEMRADQLGEDALRDASNVFPRHGVLRLRPGFSQFSATTFSGTTTGVVPYLRGAADPVPVLATTTRQYKYDAGAWSDITGSVQSATTSQPARFTTIALGSPIAHNLIHTNGANTPSKWTGSSTFSNLTSFPLWTDVATIADHVIGIVPPYTVSWCNIRSLDAPPALNTKQASETADAVVALRPLGRGLTGVLYKDRTRWAVTYTGGQTEATAFRFDFLGYYDGPASPAAVVDVDGQHVYMTPTGRVGVYDGSRHAWVADGLWPAIRDDIDTTTSGRVWGVYDPINAEVHFVYPSLAVSNAMRGWVGISLAKPDQGIGAFGAFRGQLGSALNCGATVRLTDRLDFLLVAGTKTHRFTMSAAADDGTAFSGYWQTGLLGLPGLDPLRMEAVETFAERASGYGQITVKAVTSMTLDSDGDAEDQGKPVELGTTQERPYQPVGLDTRARFVGLRYEFSDSSAVTLRWKGARMAALRGAK